MLPAITVSTVDLDRIDLLLDRLPPAQAAARDALSDELARADVVAPWDMPPRVVTMRSTVRFRLNGKESEWCKTLVYPKEAGQADDTVSVLSPVGSALLGLSEGDCIQWTHPDGRTLGVEVVDVVYQPERAGQYHL
ncbi:nucleoside diphosphate kinase regulator [Massilia phosphatilytica]|jgi:regulator of nucleoside diphosphate kinase|nr:nucleoside diphosphate kinase regulator [Massilia phosphatilytica]